MRLQRLTPIIALLLLLGPPVLAGNLVLVGNPDSGLETLEREQIVNIYMGRYRKLPSGISALPLDHTDHRETFYRTLVDKSLPAINAYWARLVFSGRGSPPNQVDTANEMLAMIADNPGAIGYLPRNEVDDRAVILSELDELSDS